MSEANKFKVGNIVVRITKGILFSDGTFHYKGQVLVVDEFTIYYYNNPINRPSYQLAEERIAQLEKENTAFRNTLIKYAQSVLVANTTLEDLLVNITPVPSVGGVQKSKRKLH